MKKVLISLVLALSVVSGCSKSDNTQAIRESAWNSLSSEDKQEAQAEWKDASVEVAEVSEMPIAKGGGKRAEVAHLYKVSFESNSDRTYGPIRVFVDGDTKKIVGYSKTVK